MQIAIYMKGLMGISGLMVLYYHDSTGKESLTILP